jgi:hypothetical protein
MSRAQLKKATITPLVRGATPISVLFNPTEYTLERSNTFKATNIPGLITPLLQFVNGESDRLNMDLFLDDYTDPKGPTSKPQNSEERSVNDRLNDLFNLLEIDPNLHAPPPVRFNWGTLDFTAVIEKLSRKVTMFHPDGTPARASLSVSFKEYRTLQEQVTKPRRQSSDKTKRRVVIGREQLWSIAAREYDDPKEWVRIAVANDLDDPREIKPGDWLSLPPIDNPNETIDAV